MSDLVRRLRKWSVFGGGHQMALAMAEAADRIEQLEAFARRVADLFDGKALGAEARAALATPSPTPSRRDER